MDPLQLISQPLRLQMAEWRHDLHSHPETAFEEHRTSDMVAAALGAMGMAVDRGLAGTGVVGTLHNGAGPSLGLRADMDALNMQEKGDCPHASAYSGKMHACGHDGHTAMLLGAAAYLSEHKPFRGTLHFIFQPAEENEGGGRRMVEQGLFERFPCDAVYGLHNFPQFPLGTFAIREGAMFSASDFFEIKITGKGAHAAAPHTGTDAIVAAAYVVAALQNVVSRNVDPLESLILSVTQIKAGDTWNVLPQEALIRGTCRSFAAPVRKLAQERIGQICDGIALSSATRIELDYREGYPAVVNPAAPTQAAIRAAQAVAGKANVDTHCRPRVGSEDFSFMQQARPGAYIMLGTARSDNDPPLHNPYYDFNDDALPFGAAYWITLAQQLLPQSQA
ncbi:M20 aminoacylase family protein [Candidimonas nitroreducens]|uniref:Peptidase M20 n=1 Tax=Candidimonas nitroreducens TaxID=683354 RepID=A0A225MSD0_9BURK|nr:M20 aminoacylase family protein [Candidimonas nitroreducens]OWT64184.1 peptidase M20 [Candidimonas nitroreducens]